MTLNEWAHRWQIPTQALDEFRAMLGVGDTPPTSGTPLGDSETAATQRVRLDSSRCGVRLWRNNNGAATDQTGRQIRYGLANDSASLSARIKSSDLIGITPYVVGAPDVGRVLGVFTSIEMKRPGWKFAGTGREQAQLAWIELILSLGGIGYFST